MPNDYKNTTYVNKLLIAVCNFHDIHLINKLNVCCAVLPKIHRKPPDLESKKAFRNKTPVPVCGLGIRYSFELLAESFFCV